MRDAAIISPIQAKCSDMINTTPLINKINAKKVTIDEGIILKNAKSQKVIPAKISIMPRNFIII